MCQVQRCVVDVSCTKYGPLNCSNSICGLSLQVLGATNDATFDEEYLAFGSAADNRERRGERAELRPEIVSGDAMEVHRAVPRRTHCGNYGSSRATECVLYGRGKRRSLENDGFREYMVADFRSRRHERVGGGDRGSAFESECDLCRQRRRITAAGSSRG